MAKQVLLFYGDEDFLIQEKIEELKQAVGDLSLNFEQIDAYEPDPSAIINNLQTPLLLAPERLLLIKNIDFRLAVWEKLIPSLEIIAPGTKVVFWAAAVDKRSRIFKAIEKVGEVYEYRAFADWEQGQVVTWIISHFRAAGIKIDQKSAVLLQGICGNSLRKLDSEIGKIITYVGNRKTIVQEDVLALASPGEASVFTFIDALLNKDQKNAFNALHQIMANREDIFSLLGLMASNFRIMLQIKSFPKANKDISSIAAAIGANPYFVKKCSIKSAEFTQAELKQALKLLLEADLELKTGREALAVFELLVTNLCLPVQAAKVDLNAR